MAVQAVVAAFGLRGKNLLWGVKSILERSDTLKKHAKEISEKVLKHPAVASPAGRSASAIGSDELLAILKEFATDNNKFLGKEAKDTLRAYINDVVPPEAQNYANQVVDEFKKLFPQEVSKLDEALNLAQRKTSKLSNELNRWFDTIMNRTTDRFVFLTRFLSITLALCLSLALQLDSLELLKNLSTNPELRAKLIQSADTTLSRAQTELLRKSIAVEALEAIKYDIAELKEKQIPNDLVTHSQGVSWLKQTMMPDEIIVDATAKYEEKFDKFTRKRLGLFGTEFQELRADLEKSRLVVFPASWEEYQKRWENIGKHTLGIIISVLLLSLGAPFWFNVLKTVATLRPILAGTTDPSKGDHRKAG